MWRLIFIQNGRKNVCLFLSSKFGRLIYHWLIWYAILRHYLQVNKYRGWLYFICRFSYFAAVGEIIKFQNEYFRIFENIREWNNSSNVHSYIKLVHWKFNKNILNINGVKYSKYYINKKSYQIQKRDPKVHKILNKGS